MGVELKSISVPFDTGEISSSKMRAISDGVNGGLVSGVSPSSKQNSAGKRSIREDRYRAKHEYPNPSSCRRSRARLACSANGAFLFVLNGEAGELSRRKTCDILRG